MSTVSLKGLVVILTLILISFFGGVVYQKKQSSSLISPTPLISPIQKLIVVSVIDGDTVKLTTGKEIRLYGVNAPEVKEPYYQEALTFTKNLVLNREIILEQEDKYKEDKFGRLLGYIFIDGKNLNVELVKNGLARVVLYEKRAKIKYQDELLQAEKEAKAKRIGVWSK